MNAIDDDELRARLPSLRRCALTLVRDPSDADDLVQASVERALSRWSTYRGDAGLKAWLFSILHRRFLDQCRRAGRWRRVLEAFGAEPGTTVPSAEDTFVARSSLQAFARSEEHTSELQSLMRISYAVFCLKKKTTLTINTTDHN